MAVGICKSNVRDLPAPVSLVALSPHVTTAKDENMLLLKERRGSTGVSLQGVLRGRWLT